MQKNDTNKYLKYQVKRYQHFYSFDTFQQIFHIIAVIIRSKRRNNNEKIQKFI